MPITQPAHFKQVSDSNHYELVRFRTVVVRPQYNRLLIVDFRFEIAFAAMLKGITNPQSAIHNFRIAFAIVSKEITNPPSSISNLQMEKAQKTITLATKPINYEKASIIYSYRSFIVSIACATATGWGRT
jgi:hypothetical protein